jgi:hypothetical protein
MGAFNGISPNKRVAAYCPSMLSATPEKKHKTVESSPQGCLIKDIYARVLDFCDFKTHGRFAQTSKVLYMITGNLPVWDKLCKKGGITVIEGETNRSAFMKAVAAGHSKALLAFSSIFSKGIHVKNNLSISISCLTKILNDPLADEETRHRALLKKCLLEDCGGYRVAGELQEIIRTSQNPNIVAKAKLVNYLLYDCDDSPEGIQAMCDDPTIKSKYRANAECLLPFEINKWDNEEHLPDEKIYELLRKASQNSEASPHFRARVDLKIFQMWRTIFPESLTQKQAQLLLQNIYQNPNIPLKIRTEAELELASMWMQKYFTNISQEEIHQRLYTISQNTEISEDFREEAVILLAKARKKKQIDLITDDEICDMLTKSMLECEELSWNSESKIKALLLKIEIRMQNITTDDQGEGKELINQLDDIINFGYPPMAPMQQKARILKAKLRLDLKTPHLTDQQAYNLLMDVKWGKEADQANLLRAKMRVCSRTDRISDDEAFDLLFSIYKSSSSKEKLKCSAGLWMAIMRAKMRTDRITDEQAIDLIYDYEKRKWPFSHQEAAARFYQYQSLPRP